MTKYQMAAGYIPALTGLAIISALSVLAIWEVKSRRHDVDTAWEAHDNVQSIAVLKDEFKDANLKETNAIPTALLFNGKGAAANSATLLANVKNIANTVGVQILSSEEIPPKTNEVSFGVTLQISGSTPGISQFLEQLEKQRPLILIDSYTVRGAALSQGNEQIEPPLTAGLTLRGQMVSASGGG